MRAFAAAALSLLAVLTAQTWTHPDLLIEFTWNTNLTPPLLLLPDGYEAQVVSVEASSASSSFSSVTSSAESLASMIDTVSSASMSSAESSVASQLDLDVSAE